MADQGRGQSIKSAWGFLSLLMKQGHTNHTGDQLSMRKRAVVLDSAEVRGKKGGEKEVILCPGRELT